MASIINPGKGFDLTALAESTDYETQAMPSIIDTLIDMFPSNIFTSFTNTNMLQIIVFSVFLGVALIMMGKEGERLLVGVQGCANAMYKITAIVMEFSPIGVCALLADSVGAYGLKIAGIFRLIDMANTTFNVTGDVVTTMVVARSEGMMHMPGTGAETETKAA